MVSEGSEAVAVLDFRGRPGTPWDAVAEVLNLARLPIPPHPRV